MKVLLLILVALLGLAYYFYFYREQAPPPKEQAAVVVPIPAEAPKASGKQGFDSLVTLLRQDMDGIPTPLDGPGRPPTNAVSIKRRVAPHLNTHPEYAVLSQTCELIIQADAQRASYQQACRSEQTRTSFGGSLSSGGSMDRASSAKRTPPPDPGPAKEAIHQRVQASWDAYRSKTATEVQGLLASLSDKRL